MRVQRCQLRRNAGPYEGAGGPGSRRDTGQGCGERGGRTICLHVVAPSSPFLPSVCVPHFPCTPPHRPLPSSSIPKGAAPTAASALPKARHLLPMLSLFSVNSVDEVRAWHRKLHAKLSAVPGAEAAAGPEGEGLGWAVEPKVDGLAVSLLYEHGRLTRVGVAVGRRGGVGGG